jgi:hypothetical protein
MDVKRQMEFLIAKKITAAALEAAAGRAIQLNRFRREIDTSKVIYLENDLQGELNLPHGLDRVIVRCSLRVWTGLI